MKLFIPFLFLIAISFGAKAQVSFGTAGPRPVVPVQRNIRYHFIGKDSVNLALNENYYLIEDSCATIIRQGHLIAKDRKFVGKFKDISQLDTSIVLTEGKYTPDGLKTGLFVAHHLNGKLQSQGVYDNNKYTGHWEVFYDNGKPQLFFDAKNDTVRVTDFWDAKGTQTVKNGKGAYTMAVAPFTWKGKLVNGLPDGTWHAFRTGDPTETSLVEESFKKGAFQDGKGPMGNYTNASHITTLINAGDIFPYTRAEQFLIGPACDAASKASRGVHFVNAQFSGGTYDFSTYIFRAVGTALTVHRGLLTESYPLKITGDISEKGELVDLKSDGPFDQGLAQEIMRQIRREVPLLDPATANGTPIRQPIVITVTFKGSLYTIAYRFMPLKQTK